MIYNLSATFVEKVYPKLGTPEAWSVYKEEYLLPNFEILNMHLNRWGEIPEHKLKAEVEQWEQSKFEKTIAKVADFDVSKVEQILASARELLGEVDNPEIYFLIGNFRSGLYVTKLAERDVIVVAFEIIANFGDLERVIVPSLSHEIFHLFHYARLEEHDLPRANTFAQSLAEEGLASYFSYIMNSHMKLTEVLLLSSQQIAQIKANERRYWMVISEAIRTKPLEECCLLFNAPEAMWRERLDYTPEWPPRVSYYYSFKIIESYIEEHGEEYIKELMLKSPEEIIANSPYIKELIPV